MESCSSMGFSFQLTRYSLFFLYLDVSKKKKTQNGTEWMLKIIKMYMENEKGPAQHSKR